MLPEEALRRRTLTRRVLDQFSLWGYAVVTPPVFEFADVLERGLGTLDPAEVLRFVEPESGEVAALRPDMTPQIARIIATRLAERPPPFRLAYEGSVLRRRSGRARTRRQIPQVGIELAGLGGAAGDLELLVVAVDAVRAAGLETFTIDLGSAAIVRSLLADAPDPVARAITETMARKDEVDLALALKPLGARATELERILVELLRLSGPGAETLARGKALLASTRAAHALDELSELYALAVRAGLDAHLAIDLGEVRGFAYYTGMIFHVYAPGPGEAVGAGGRYDELLARFGPAMPATGFALDLDALESAVVALAATRGATPFGVPRAVAVADDVATRLRQAGIAAVTVADRAAAVAYAAAWDFACVVDGERVCDRSGAPIAGVTTTGLLADPASVFSVAISHSKMSTRG
jgi:ATP phosphoribosyltransferase regulatory subunit